MRARKRVAHQVGKCLAVGGRREMRQRGARALPELARFLDGLADRVRVADARDDGVISLGGAAPLQRALKPVFAVRLDVADDGQRDQAAP